MAEGFQAWNEGANSNRSDAEAWEGEESGAEKAANAEAARAAIGADEYNFLAEWTGANAEDPAEVRAAFERKAQTVPDEDDFEGSPYDRAAAAATALKAFLTKQ